MTVKVSLTQARIDMSELDEDSDGFLQSQVSGSKALSLEFAQEALGSSPTS